MGIQGWFTVFGDSAVIRKEKDFKGKRIGVDVSYDIYRASLGMKNIKGLTDKTGTPTVLLNTLLCNIVRYKKLGVKGLIYVFDNPKPNPLKIKEAAKRRSARKKAIDKINDGHPDIEQLEKRTFVITDAMVNDVKKLLTLLGVAWIIAPEGCEAEHLGAALTESDVIDTFITSDSDTLLFGGTSMTRRVKKGSTKVYYEEYILDNILTDYELTRDQMIHMSLLLGCDFANKTKGIGPNTVLKKGLTLELTDEQKIAETHFLSKCVYTDDMIKKSAPNKEELIEWLVDDKGFNEQRIKKLLQTM